MPWEKLLVPDTSRQAAAYGEVDIVEFLHTFIEALNSKLVLRGILIPLNDSFYKQ